MTWRYRVVVFGEPGPQIGNRRIELAQVFYDQDDQPAALAQPVHEIKETDPGTPIDRLRERCLRLLAACDQPFLRYPADFSLKPPVDDPRSRDELDEAFAP
jgi:hypothetical protein